MKQIRPRLPVVGLLIRSAVIPTVLLFGTGMRMVMFAPAVHMAVVGAAGALAAPSAVSMSIIAARRNDGHAVWIGMAFSAIAMLLIIHGLATPGVILPANAVVQVAGALNLPVCGAILAASGMPILRRPRRVKLLLAVQLGLVAALAVAGAAALVFSPAIGVVPDPSTLAANLIVILGAIPLGLLAWRAGRTYLLTRRLSDLIVVEGIVWLIGAQYGLINFTMTDAAWWAAHVLEFAGIGMVAIPVALDLRHAVASRPLIGTCALATWSSTKRLSWAVASAPCWSGSAKRTRRRRDTRAGSRRWRSRSASDWVCRTANCASSRWADCSTMWASCRCRTRS